MKVYTQQEIKDALRLWEVEYRNNPEKFESNDFIGMPIDEYVDNLEIAFLNYLNEIRKRNLSIYNEVVENKDIYQSIDGKETLIKKYY